MDHAVPDPTRMLPAVAVVSPNGAPEILFTETTPSFVIVESPVIETAVATLDTEPTMIFADAKVVDSADPLEAVVIRPFESTVILLNV